MNNNISSVSKIFLLIAAAGLVMVLYTPIWRIELDAPQYPEGLRLTLYAKGLRGNVDIINGLNHYIGMKTLHSEDFFEFKVLPPIIIFFALAFILTAFLGKRKWLYTLFSTFVLFGVVAMIDFWRWEYDYGHNLNPDAAIIVPGMAYQPPLIGFKQLLNFGAYSIPDVGGWIFIGVGVLLLFLVIKEWRTYKKNKSLISRPNFAVMLMVVLFFSSCNNKPELIVVGKDNCTFCKMTISDNRYGAEIVTTKGKVYKFDDSHCLIAFLDTKVVAEKNISAVYFTDFTGQHNLINADVALLFQSNAVKGPMNGNIAAFSNMDSMKKMKDQNEGLVVEWKQLKK